VVVAPQGALYHHHDWRAAGSAGDRTLPSEVHGVAIAKGWEHLILLGGRGAPLDDYPAGFAVPLPGSPSAFVSVSSGPNVRTREIASVRHPVPNLVCTHFSPFTHCDFICLTTLGCCHAS
jgi:hypothetical protein